MTPFDRVREAVQTYRRAPLYSDDERSAAEVVADACEEAGLLVDAAWYRFAAADGIGDRPAGEPVVWASDPDRLDEVLARAARSSERRGGST